MHGEPSPGEELAHAQRLDDAVRVVCEALRRIGIPECEVRFETVSVDGDGRIALPVLGPHGWFATLVCSSAEALTRPVERQAALLATYLSVWCTEHGIVDTAALGLTPRQLEIARHAARGETNAEIADALGISVNTVKRRLKQVFEQLDICNRTELAQVLIAAPRRHPSGY